MQGLTAGWWSSHCVHAATADWRLDPRTMASNGALNRLVKKITAVTKKQGPGILIAHSTGALVALKLLQAAGL